VPAHGPQTVLWFVGKRGWGGYIGVSGGGYNEVLALEVLNVVWLRRTKEMCRAPCVCISSSRVHCRAVVITIRAWICHSMLTKTNIEGKKELSVVIVMFIILHACHACIHVCIYTQVKQGLYPRPHWPCSTKNSPPQHLRTWNCWHPAWTSRGHPSQPHFIWHICCWPHPRTSK